MLCIRFFAEKETVLVTVKERLQGLYGLLNRIIYYLLILIIKIAVPICTFQI